MTFYLQKTGTYLGKAYLFILDVSKGEVIVGRETHPLLHNLSDVSERQAAFGKTEAGEWYVKDISKQNSTFLNRFRLDNNVRYLLRARDRIGFGTDKPDRNHISICYDFCVRPRSEEMKEKDLIDDLEDRMWSKSLKIVLDSNGPTEPYLIQDSETPDPSKCEPEIEFPVTSYSRACCHVGKGSVPFDYRDIWNSIGISDDSLSDDDAFPDAGRGNPSRESRDGCHSGPHPQ